jgi:FHA domain-containing protein
MYGFIEAAGLDSMVVPALPLEQRMAQLGRLFRLFADGTVRLLSSRALVKREVRAEVTRVTQEANNPFKVLPSGEAVMIQMFGQHLPGFLGAEQAIGEALADLQHHQLGMLAGTRAALLGLVRQLDPQAWERKIEPSGLLDRLFPQRVAARRWQHYTERYRSVLALAQANDFHRLFGASFLRAYEDEISRCSEAEPRVSEGASA